MLPVRRRLMGLSRRGWFSLIGVRLGRRGCPSSVWRIIRVLYMAVKVVATRVVKRAQALV